MGKTISITNIYPWQQLLYHAVSVVGTLLLQIGEVGQKFGKAQSQANNEQGNAMHSYNIAQMEFILYVHDVVTLQKKLRYFRLNIIRLQSKIFLGHMN